MAPHVAPGPQWPQLVNASFSNPSGRLAENLSDMIRVFVGGYDDALEIHVT